MSWTVEFQYTSGGTWYDVTNNVERYSFSRDRQHHRELNQRTWTLSFEMIEYGNTIVNNLLTEEDIHVRVHLDSADYFTGTVRNTYKVKTRKNSNTIKVECVGYGDKLDKPMEFTAGYIEYTLIDSTNTGSSLIHQLFSQHGDGLTVSASCPDISKTVPYFVNVDVVDDKKYRDVINTLMFEAGYVWWFDESGEFMAQAIYPSSISPSTTLDDDKTSAITVTKRREKHDGIEVRYPEYETANGAVVYSDTTGGGDGQEMAVDIAAGDSYPDKDGDTTVYAEFEVNGNKVVYSSGQKLVYSPTSLTKNTFNAFPRRAEVQLDNNTGGTVTLEQFRITADAVYELDIVIIRDTNYSSVNPKRPLKYQIEYIADATTADDLCWALRQYYEYSDFSYKFTSEDKIEPGDYIILENANLGISNTVQVVRVVDTHPTETPRYSYVCEGVSAYTEETNVFEKMYVNDNGRAQQLIIRPTYAAIEGGEIIVASFDYPGDAPATQCDGLNDAEEINRAIDDLVSNYGGGRVKLTRGTFNIDSDQIVVKPGVALTGEGMVTQIVCRQNDSRIEVRGQDADDDIQLSSFSVTQLQTDTIDGGNAGTSGATDLDGGTATTTSGTERDGGNAASEYLTSSTPIVDVKTARDIWITDIKVTNSFASGVHVRNSRNVTIRGVIASRCDKAGILVEGAEIDGGDATTSYVSLYDRDGGDSTTTSGTELDGGTAESSNTRNVLIHECSCDTNNIGIDVSAEESIISDCSARENTETGFVVRGVQVHIGNSVAALNASNGFQIIGTNQTVNGNRAKSNSTVGYRIASDTSLFTGNFASGSTTGFLIESGADDNVLTGNLGTANGTNRTDNGTGTQETGNVF